MCVQYGCSYRFIPGIPGVNRYRRGKSLQCESSDFEVTSRSDFSQ